MIGIIINLFLAAIFVIVYLLVILIRFIVDSIERNYYNKLAKEEQNQSK